MLINE
jgi:hypothetical protein